MSAKAKGARRERQVRDFLRKLGYRVTRSGASLGEWDLIGFCDFDAAVLVQIKSNRPPRPAERKRMEEFPALLTRKLYVVILDRNRSWDWRLWDPVSKAWIVYHPKHLAERLSDG